MIEDDFVFPPSVSECIALVHKVKKSLTKQSTENLVNMLINFETTHGITLPNDITVIIDDYFESPIFPESHRNKLEAFIILLECDLMISEEGDIFRTVIR
jgi:hypothetical protein